jgi:hypothetical protein
MTEVDDYSEYRPPLHKHIKDEGLLLIDFPTE